MNKFILLIALTFFLASVSAQDCPVDQYFNSSCGKCMRCQWIPINPALTSHWCRCNCYITGTSSLNSGSCLIDPTKEATSQGCKWQCANNEATSSNGTFASTDEYQEKCIAQPQCSSNCYECSGSGTSKQCTICDYGYKLNNGSCVASDSCASDLESCANFQCPSDYINQNLVSTVINQDNCCLFQPTCASYTCPQDQVVQNENSTDLSDANCCQQTCQSFVCPDGFSLDQNVLQQGPASQGLCCFEVKQQSAPDCSNYTCPETYVLTSDPVALLNTDLNDTNCCVPTCAVAGITCQAEQYLNITADYPNCCQPCQWQVIEESNCDITQDWCNCNCYVPGTDILRKQICLVDGVNELSDTQRCQWICPGNQQNSQNGTLNIQRYLTQCNN